MIELEGESLMNLQVRIPFRVRTEKPHIVILLIHFVEVPFRIEQGNNEHFLAAAQAAHDL